RDVPRVARTLPMRIGSPPRERRREDAGIALRHFQPEAVAVPAIRELVDEHGLRHARPDAAEVLVIATAGDRDRMQMEVAPRLRPAFAPLRSLSSVSTSIRAATAS